MDMDAKTDSGISESNYEVGSISPSHNPGESTLFLPSDTVFLAPVCSECIYPLCLRMALIH